ncbi:MAG: hypothetical protein mread185_000117 [Mycoplasmataceae bacterium]|nr:MAG: hypothetical protein mread185_000117 [Mycoplasmataceae bacterium]
MNTLQSYLNKKHLNSAQKTIEVKRGNIYWMNFDSTVGTEIYKIRPALIILVSEAQVIALPITSNTKENKKWQLVVLNLVKNKDGKILLDQIRVFDKQRLLRKIGEIKPEEMNKVNRLLKKMLLI